MLYCISGIVGLQLNILLTCIKSVGRIAFYHRGHIALKHGSDWNIPMSEFHLASTYEGRLERRHARPGRLPVQNANGTALRNEHPLDKRQQAIEKFPSISRRVVCCC